LSEEDKSIKFKFQPDALVDWKELAVQYLGYSNELIRSHLCDDMKVTEVTAHELYKLSVNSLIFRDFLNELQEVVTIDEHGALHLTEEDIANVWKCLLSLSESKKFLLDTSLSLEKH